MKYRSYIDLENTFNVSNVYVDNNYNEYVECLNDQLYNQIKDFAKTVTIVSKEFENIICTFYYDEIIGYNDLARLFIKFETDKKIDTEILYDSLKADTKFLEQLKKETINFIEESNQLFEHIKFPIDVDIIFYNDNIYVKTNPKSLNNVQWLSFAIEDSYIDEQELIEYLEEY